MTSLETPADTCARLRSILEAALDPLVPRGARTVLAGSGLSNAGDCVIAEATRAWLAGRDASPRLEVGRRTYRRRDVERALGADGVLLLAGGGTIGDVWPSQEAFRVRLLTDLRERAIVQLPQTVRWRDPASAGPSREAYGAAKKLTLLVRDRPSADAARDLLGVGATLVPDMAFLSPPPPPPPVVRDLLVLLRRDQEATGHVPPTGAVDWPDNDDRGRARRRRRLVASLRWTLGVGAGRRAEIVRIERELGAERVAAARALVGSARVVVTDRLHAGIVALLLGRPLVLLPDRYGKVADHHAAWTSSCAAIRLAPDVTSARTMAAEWLAQRPARLPTP